VGNSDDGTLNFQMAIDVFNQLLEQYRTKIADNATKLAQGLSTL
jgi:hypothetical protein